MKISINQLQTIILKELGIKSSKNILSEASLKDRIKEFQTIIGMENPTGDWVKDKTDDAWVAFLNKSNDVMIDFYGDMDLEKIGTNWKDKSGHPGYSANLAGITEFAQDLKGLVDSKDERKAQEVADKLESEKQANIDKARQEKMRLTASWPEDVGTKYGDLAYSGTGAAKGIDLSSAKIELRTKMKGTFHGRKKELNLGMVLKITIPRDENYFFLRVMPGSLESASDIKRNEFYVFGNYKQEGGFNLVGDTLKRAKTNEELINITEPVIKNRRGHITGKGIVALAAAGFKKFGSQLDYEKLSKLMDPKSSGLPSERNSSGNV